MTLPTDGDGPTFRLIKTRSDDGVTLVARDDETGETLGEIKFSSMREAYDCANAIIDTVEGPPNFAAWDISLHG